MCNYHVESRNAKKKGSGDGGQLQVDAEAGSELKEALEVRDGELCYSSCHPQESCIKQRHSHMNCLYSSLPVSFRFIYCCESKVVSVVAWCFIYAKSGHKLYKEGCLHRILHFTKKNPVHLWYM